MTIGDSSAWDDFIAQGGVGTVIGLVLESWALIAPPAPDELEEDTSIRLYAAMVRKRDRQAHRFLIRYEDVEIDVDLAKETGRKDIVFFPGHDGDLYFCLEAKRLNARVKGVMKSLADEYVKEGMQRFVDGKYGRHVHHGGMLGYVLDGDVPRAMRNVLSNIRTNHAALGMDPPGEWVESRSHPGDDRAKESEHRRAQGAQRFLLHHQFVSARTTATPATTVSEVAPNRPSPARRKRDSGEGGIQ
ncbi:hypothetical protein [Tautonia sociabilis]|uniref:Uncharacterized protein n=1 Tax=Tautonia sociabilis TaxID=2080755 RepID=A0A432MQ31_9BACT|nr:hypothetical protein [Tautonia sociabilis]RUL89460.1 hypothetical protein TsocGM_01420 [Tautonia sociabilis]